MGKRVFVPLDGSRVSEAAIPHAVSIARAMSADMVLLRVVEESAYPPEVPLPLDRIAREEASRARAATEYLEQIRRHLENEGLGVHTHVALGPAAKCISACALKSAADLIVMATHGRSLFGKLFRGSVCDEVIRSGTVPVLVVRSS